MEPLKIYQTLPELNKIEGVKSLPSVSKIFQAVDKGVMEMVKLMKDKNSKQGAVIRKAVQTGTAAHKVLETKTVVKTEDTDPIIEEMHAQEKGVYYPEQYKGKFDSVGVINGQATLWDYKKTNSPKRKSNMKTYFKQICAYTMAHNLIYEHQIKQVGVLNIFGKTPETVSSQVILLTLEELTYYSGLFKEDLNKYNEITKQTING